MIDTLRELLGRRPFTPFRVILSSGTTYDVRHPVLAWLVKGGLYVGLPGDAPSNGHPELPDRAVFCSALHLAGAEELVGN
ncbi:MAG TPA: hypothetical protein VHZ24_06215 [Pirellulales bacterium]|jgi:hypothetical protein|nr:hypothetical protein [Pirellulales bacterium]